MFTQREKKLLRDGYFTIIRNEEDFIEIRSNNTNHLWIVRKHLAGPDTYIMLYHKHSEKDSYYHKHRKNSTVAKAIENIKNHDTYVIQNREGKI